MFMSSSPEISKDCELKKMLLSGKPATDAETVPATQLASCKNLCSNLKKCDYFAFDSEKETCALLSSFDKVKENDNAVSGAYGCEGKSHTHTRN